MSTKTLQSNYTKESVRAIVINEGIFYGVRHFMDETDISKNEKSLRENWMLCHSMWNRLDVLVDRPLTTEATKWLFEMEGAEDVVLLYKNERFADVLSNDTLILECIQEIRRLSKLITDELGLTPEGKEQQ